MTLQVVKAPLQDMIVVISKKNLGTTYFDRVHFPASKEKNKRINSQPTPSGGAMWETIRIVEDLAVKTTCLLNRSLMWKMVQLEVSFPFPCHPWDWYIYQHLIDFYGKWREMYHTWMLWVCFLGKMMVSMVIIMQKNMLKSDHF